MNKNILLPLMVVAAGVVSRWGLMGPGESTVVAVLREPDDIRGGKLQFQQRPALAPVAVSALQPDFALPMTDAVVEAAVDRPAPAAVVATADERPVEVPGALVAEEPEWQEFESVEETAGADATDWEDPYGGDWHDQGGG